MNITRDSSVGPCHIRRLDQSTKSSLRSKALMHQVAMKRLACSLGWTTLLVLTAQSAQSDPVEYQCFERSTRRPVAASLVDLSTPEVSCEPTTLKTPSVATPEQESRRQTKPASCRSRGQHRPQPLRRHHTRPKVRESVCPRQSPRGKACPKSGKRGSNPAKRRPSGLPPGNLHVWECD